MVSGIEPATLRSPGISFNHTTIGPLHVPCLGIAKARDRVIAHCDAPLTIELRVLCIVIQDPVIGTPIRSCIGNSFRFRIRMLCCSIYMNTCYDIFPTLHPFNILALHKLNQQPPMDGVVHYSFMSVQRQVISTAIVMTRLYLTWLHLFPCADDKNDYVSNGCVSNFVLQPQFFLHASSISVPRESQMSHIVAYNLGCHLARGQTQNLIRLERVQLYLSQSIYQGHETSAVSYYGWFVKIN